MTEGFVAQRQKESILTLRRESGPKPEDYPRGFLELFARLFRSTERGQPVDVGDSALFSDADFLPDKNIRGIGYAEPQGLLGVETGDVPLPAILLKGRRSSGRVGLRSYARHRIDRHEIPLLSMSRLVGPQT